MSTYPGDRLGLPTSGGSVEGVRHGCRVSVTRIRSAGCGLLRVETWGTGSAKVILGSQHIRQSLVSMVGER